MKSFLKKPNNFFDSNLETFDKFCKKYKKNNYISTIDKKRLTSIGLDFESLQNKVRECIKYFNKQDIQLLHDLLYYVVDDVDKVTGFGNIWFSIRFYIASKDEIVVSLNDDGLPSKEHKKINDEMSIINLITNRIYDKFSREYNLLEYEKEKTKWYAYLSAELKNTNFNKIKLHPIINIDFEINHNYNYPQTSSFSSFQLNQYLSNEILNRYFEQIKIEKNINLNFVSNYNYEFNTQGITVEIN